jgi:hypothetical protein
MFHYLSEYVFSLVHDRESVFIATHLQTTTDINSNRAEEKYEKTALLQSRFGNR